MPFNSSVMFFPCMCCLSAASMVLEETMKDIIAHAKSKSLHEVNVLRYLIYIYIMNTDSGVHEDGFGSRREESCCRCTS